MNLKHFSAFCLSGVMLLSFCGCNDSSSLVDSGTERIAQTVDAMQFTADGVIQTDQRFLADYSQLALSAPEGAVIRYTLDGSVPTESSEQYTEPIVLEQYVGDFPNCAVLRAKAFFADGTESDTVTQTFWTAFDINARFHNLVISVVGDPAEITEGPDGIFYGENAKKHGRDYERGISVEFVSANGELLLEQDCGMRAFGAASRMASLKSMKLFARKSYDPEHGKFAYDGFGTVGADGEVISKYDKLVLRNAGNDFQFAFIRDELCQVLAKEAGYSDYEAVKPAVIYLNGSYYGLYWVHEAYCDDLLKDKYGGGDGKYVILEGKEQEKNVPEDDDETAEAAEAFNTRYEELISMDLTDDDAYAEVCAFLDVENYLEYFAFNIYINNNDWPQNNQKCYRYYAADGEAYSTDSDSRTDGRWRFYYHDMDYSTGLYGQDETMANYNNLAKILDPSSDRYAPLFAKLTEREDCRAYFISEMNRLMNGVLSADSLGETLDTMISERYMEMLRYFDYLEELKKTDDSIWIWYNEYQNRVNNIRNFANERASYMQDYLDAAFPSAADTADSGEDPSE